ncbi:MULTISPECIES: hypothetical protein [Methanohalobium]|jgi:hypothetical protein|uniref:Uncharacterized protein n=1 Tax=Methanohalobium evestigatum (strain ATCC BAA-1072 / DSM 3721 / NBRC 107634 / OCM 161 / Z-7303) TaxID=644295 RepID=D7E8M2_METEZ|nr:MULTISPECIES: hypothetical protein [Methanohalobium]ADI73693.1 hypothetical protein Metev_0793 [Methanohalobium evestigatum Z-7303]
MQKKINDDAMENDLRYLDNIIKKQKSKRKKPSSDVARWKRQVLFRKQLKEQGIIK